VATKKLTKSGQLSAPKTLVEKVDIFALGVDSLSANLDRANYASAYAEKKVTRRVESDYRVTDFSEEHFDISATLHLRVEAKGLTDPVLSLDVTISGHFHPKTKVSREEAESFAKAEARLIFWPYFRQVVSDTTSRMHIYPVTLPLAIS
jgi:preprotein translocase subunit SecB